MVSDIDISTLISGHIELSTIPTICLSIAGFHQLFSHESLELPSARWARFQECNPRFLVRTAERSLAFARSTTGRRSELWFHRLSSDRWQFGIGIGFRFVVVSRIGALSVGIAVSARSELGDAKLRHHVLMILLNGEDHRCSD